MIESPAFLRDARGARRFIAGVLDDLRDGRNAVVLLPPDVPPRAIADALTHEASLRREDFSTVAATGGEPLADFLSSLCLPSGMCTGADGLEAICALKGLPQFVIVEDLHDCERATQLGWVEWFLNWASVGKRISADRHYRPRVCLVLPALVVDSAVADDIHLAVHRWWAVMGAADVQSLLNLGRDGRTPDTAAAWEDAIVASVAGGDLLLVASLTGHSDSETTICNVLTEFARERRWTAADVDSARAWLLCHGATHGRASAFPSPPDDGVALWRLGLLQQTREWGAEVSTAAMVVLGLRHEVRHRIWRAQVRLAFPLIDLLRLHVCSDLMRRHGSKWPSYVPPDDERESQAMADPMCCGLGHLEALLLGAPQLRNDRRWLSFVRHARAVRNELAHYRLISFSDFSRLASGPRSLQSDAD